MLARLQVGHLVRQHNRIDGDTPKACNTNSSGETARARAPTRGGKRVQDDTMGDPQRRPYRPRPARGPKLVCLVMSEYYIIVKTFNNGSLGSGIDEERSEMR
jgi:hypothetical protein